MGRSRGGRAAAALLTLALATFVFMTLGIVPRPEQRGAIEPSSLRSDGGHAWIAPLEVKPCDQTGGSLLQLFEDGRPLGPAHSPHLAIRAQGGGRYSHAKTWLRFAASDNSDPRTNSRTYTWVAARPIPGWLWIAVSGAWLVLNASSLWRWRRPETMTRLDRVAAVVLVAALTGLVAWNALSRLDGAPATGDSEHNVRMGYNLFRHGTISLSEDPDSAPPSSYREPVLPALIAITLRLVPGVTGETTREEVSEGPLLRDLKCLQVALLALTALATMVLVRGVTGNPLASLAAAALVGFSSALIGHANTMMAEVLSALLIVALGALLQRAVAGPRWWVFALVGGCLGALILTRAVFLYFTPLLVLGFLHLLLLRKFADRRSMLACAAACFGSLLLVVAPWCARNYVHLGSWSVTQRGGVVLLVRAEKNLMNREEFLGSFWLWAPPGFIKAALAQRFGYGLDDLAPGGRLERLNRALDTSFYQIARARRAQLWRKLGDGRTPWWQGPSQAADVILKREAMEKIKADPGRHLLATIPFAWRGHSVESGFEFGSASIKWPPLNLVYWTALAVALVASLRRRDWAMLYLFAPTVFLFGIQSLLTHNLPRYNQPLVPMLAVALAICATRAWRRAHQSESPTGADLKTAAP